MLCLYRAATTVIGQKIVLIHEGPTTITEISMASSPCLPRDFAHKSCLGGKKTTEKQKCVPDRIASHEARLLVRAFGYVRRIPWHGNTVAVSFFNRVLELFKCLSISQAVAVFEFFFVVFDELADDRGPPQEVEELPK